MASTEGARIEAPQAPSNGDNGVCLPAQIELNVVMIQRKVSVGSVSFNQNWAAYRDGFGSVTGTDNYWLGLGKVYCFLQRGHASLSIQV